MFPGQIEPRVTLPKYALKLITAPAEEPITRAEAKVQCRVESDNTIDDDYFDTLIQTAREYAENFTGQRFITQTWEVKFDQFIYPYREIKIPFGSPLQSVTSITYLDQNGTSTTLSSSLYVVDIYSQIGSVYPAWAQIWPAQQDIQNAITIRYVAGYGLQASVPARIKHAIKIMVAQWYEYREPVLTGVAVNKVPDMAHTLLTQERASWL